MDESDHDEYDSEAAYDLLRTELKRLHREMFKDYDAIARVMSEMDRAHRDFKFACGRSANPVCAARTTHQATGPARQLN